MKIRIKFVSNSSSSSFTFVGQPVSAMRLNESEIEKHRYIVIGGGLADGTDIFDIDSVDILYFLKAFENLDLKLEYCESGFKIYKVFDINPEDSNELVIDVKKLTKSGEVHFVSDDKDYHCSTTYKDLLNKYVYSRNNIEDDFFGVMERFKRKAKLKQIKNQIDEI
jgi:hypothetical protein